MGALGIAVKRFREKAGLSLQEVADRAALSKTHIWEIEIGSVNPTIKSLCCIAVALDVEADELAAAAITDAMKSLNIGTAQHKFILPASLSSHKRPEAE